jgi:hypothetical protein
MKKLLCALLGLLLLTPAVADETRVPAFPGAEGFGRYTQGGRGGKVYHVTTLEDSTTPTAGMLRYALNQKGARTIVFDVAGTIRLKAELKIKNDYVTLAGQTAPGDGICIADYPVVIAANQVIVRYLRFRLGNHEVANHEGDGLGAMDKNDIIVDHCTISWSVDECCSIYGGKNLTVQWCIISQSMRDCGHSKGTHGYGGNWGGSGCTYAHNLLCHHESRTPRLGPRPGTQTDERLDMRNNVIYNWAGNGCYGGEGMNVNIVNNYYKPGPATAKKSASTIQRRIASPGIRTTSYCQNSDGSWNSWYAMWHVWGDYYVDGNVNPKYADVTKDNWTYGVYNQIDGSKNDNTYTQATKDTLRVDQPLVFPATTTFTAEEAYQKVLDYAGCIKVRDGQLVRDYLDSVMVSDTRKGVATYGNSNNLPGIIADQDDCIDAAHPDPWPTLTATDAEVTRQSTDSNQDGIPDDYQSRYAFAQAGDKYEQSTEYTNLELYLNGLVGDITDACLTGGELLGDEVGYYIMGQGGSSALESTQLDRDAAARTQVYDLTGRQVRRADNDATALRGLAPGLYLVDGHKVAVR